MESEHEVTRVRGFRVGWKFGACRLPRIRRHSAPKPKPETMCERLLAIALTGLGQAYGLPQACVKKDCLELGTAIERLGVKGSQGKFLSGLATQDCTGTIVVSKRKSPKLA